MNIKITNSTSKKVVFTLKTLALSAALVLAACAAKPPAEKISTTADPTAEIQATESALEQARSQQVDVFAPKNYSKASKSLDKAKEARADQDKNETILKHVAESRAWLEQAKQRAQVSKTATASLEQARSYAVQSGAPEVYPKDFKKIESNMKSFTEDMEGGDLAKADKKSAELASDYRNLEVRTLKKTLLGKAEDNIKKARDEGAKKTAPKSLAAAETKVSSVHSAIDADPRNTAALKAAADDATKESEHALTVTRQVKGTQNRSTEDLVLKSELQDKAITSLAEEKATELAAAEAQNEQLAARTAQTQARLLTLQEKQAAQAKIDAVRDNFTPQEADVLQEGDKVLIRLKGLNFKSNQAVIEPKYYPLLKKVQDSLKEINASAVVIEGHTDAVGKADANLVLSEKRAAAVEKYLVSNNAVNGAQVETKGLGFEKPITENKTPKGRATNRRIDLIITPQ